MELASTRSNIRERGSAMVELVFILPVILMLVFAIAEFGVAFAQWQTINNAAREGARTAILFRGSCDAGAVDTEVRSVVDGYVATMGIDTTSLMYQLTGQCTGAGNPVTVDISTDYDFSVLPNFVGSLGPSLTLRGVSTMRNEG